jgi:hypothetical protein
MCSFKLALDTAAFTLKEGMQKVLIKNAEPTSKGVLSNFIVFSYISLILKDFLTIHIFLQ